MLGNGQRGIVRFWGARGRVVGGMAQQKDDTILEAQRSKLKPPPMFKVMLLNDDYTPMEFVVRGAAEVLRHDAGNGPPRSC